MNNLIDSITDILFKNSHTVTVYGKECLAVPERNWGAVATALNSLQDKGGKLVEQDKTNDTFELGGNCLQAAIASLLQIPLDHVPHFMTFGEDYWADAMRLFMKSKGYETEDYRREPPPCDGNIYLTIQGEENDWSHAVLYKDGELYHDPHPTDKAVRQINGYYRFVKSPDNLQQKEEEKRETHLNFLTKQAQELDMGYDQPREGVPQSNAFEVERSLEESAEAWLDKEIEKAKALIRTFQDTSSETSREHFKMSVWLAALTHVKVNSPLSHPQANEQEGEKSFKTAMRANGNLLNSDVENWWTNVPEESKNEYAYEYYKKWDSANLTDSEIEPIYLKEKGE